MARVIPTPYARYTHSCGATVEFDLADLSHDHPGDPAYVVCPACGGRVISKLLRWRKPKPGELK
jgi:DNA-directed RNA polymerase subunit RPC12/RpoP